MALTELYAVAVEGRCLILKFSMNLFDLYLPLASKLHSSAEGAVPYLLQPNFPLLLTNTAFGFEDAAHTKLEARFNQVGAPMAYTLSEGTNPKLAEMGFQPSAQFEVCQSEPSKRAYWTEHVPWSEAWTIAKILTEAYGAPDWRFPFSQALGKLLQNPQNSAFVAYLYGDAVGAIVTSGEVGILAGVVPQRQGQDVGLGLLGRINPKPFIRLTGTETELPGRALERFVRYEDTRSTTSPKNGPWP